MSQNEITVSIECTFEGLPDKSWFEENSVKILDFYNSEEPVELSLVITDNPQMQQLNRMYKGEDYPTDVLSFALSEETDLNNSDGFIVPPDGIRHLGEVIISYPKALEQSREHGHHVRKELALLLVHGILHLFGYDHGEPGEMTIMQAKEAEILKEIYPAEKKEPDV